MQRTSSDLTEWSGLVGKRTLTATSSVNLTRSMFEPPTSVLSRHGSSSSLLGNSASKQATTTKTPSSGATTTSHPSFTRSVSASFGSLTRSMSNSSFSGSDFNARNRQVRPQSTYICRVQSSVWRLPKYWVCSPPGDQRRGVGRWGDGGSIFWKTPDIGLASYSLIPLLRVRPCGHFRRTAQRLRGKIERMRVCLPFIFEDCVTLSCGDHFMLKNKK